MTAGTFEMNNVPCGKIPDTKRKKHGLKKIDLERLGEKHPYALLLVSCVINPILILFAVGSVIFAAALLVTLMTGGPL